MRTLALSAALRIQERRLWGTLGRQAEDPATTQAATLAEILATNRDTRYGLQHRFGRIESPRQFAEAVPVNDYEALRPLIESQADTRAAELTREDPLLYSRTSGTTGVPKLVPLTPEGLARQSRAQRIFATAIHRGSGIFAGRLLGIGSPAVEERLPNRRKVGSASGVIYESMPRLVRSKYVLPPAVLGVSDDDSRYWLIAVLGMAHGDLTGLGTANPSTLLRLRDTMCQHWDDLVRSVATGRLPEGLDASAALRASVRARLGRRPQRARDLRALGDPAGRTIARVWPRLAAVTTWTHGSCAVALQRLREHLDARTAVIELGYSASELRGTVCHDVASGQCVPLLGDVYYEFVERDAWEAGERATVGLADLDLGGQYYVVITTVDGLYRYDMNDILEVTGRLGATPCLAFVQKGRGVTNITGEKLHESQVIDAVLHAGGGRAPGAGFFVMLADTPAAAYRLVVEGPLDDAETEGLAERVDVRLTETNVEYRAKRRSGRLGQVQLQEVATGSGRRYRAYLVATGQRETQLKVQHLQRAEDVAFDFVAGAADGDTGDVEAAP
ncbi:MAG: GH3 auxin-responsive promoter family protein [Acidimicrobiales bacterium]|nr:GH3 auxin-responsive promoter family protein [Acidimicrobiales bacterium]